MWRLLGMIMVIGSFFSVYAEHCPSVAEVKHKRLIGWEFYDSKDRKALTAPRIARFKAGITQFVLAEWQAPKPGNNIIHCYYRDHAGSTLDVFLAKHSYQPNPSPNWYAVTGAMHCAAGMQQCAFHTTQLAQLN